MTQLDLQIKIQKPVEKKKTFFSTQKLYLEFYFFNKRIYIAVSLHSILKIIGRIIFFIAHLESIPNDLNWLFKTTFLGFTVNNN